MNQHCYLKDNVSNNSMTNFYRQEIMEYLKSMSQNERKAQ